MCYFLSKRTILGVSVLANEPNEPNERLRYERIRRGWSQQDVADMVGTTPLTIGRWERGVTIPGPHFRQKLSETFDKSLAELGLVGAPVHHDEAADIPLNVSPLSPGPEAPAASFWNVPYNRNLLFTGREDILAQLHDAFLNGAQPVALAQPYAISGLGGIGKTQTAVEYAYRSRESYEAVLWARADSVDLLTSDFLLIAALLNLPQRNDQDQTVVVKAVLHWFDTHEQWLLILDNADNLEMVSDFIPSSDKGHVLLTTRANSTGTLAQRIELDTMGIEEGTLFLLRRAKRLKGTSASLQAATQTERSQAQAIVEAVDGLPLALDQAGAYIDETGCTLSDYLKFYQTRRKRLLRTRGHNATGHPEPVATTWSLSFEKVEQTNPAAAALLRLCAFLHPDEIPEAVIVAGASQLGPLLQALAEDELELNEAIGELRKYSLVKRDPEKKILNIHRLVQAVIKDAMDKETQRDWAERTVRIINEVFPDGEDVEAWQLCQQYLPHAQACAELMEHWDIDVPEATQLLNKIGNYLLQRGQYIEAEPPYQRALAIRERILGIEHLDIATSLNNLGRLYKEQGKYTQAEPLLIRALTMREKILGLEHADVATSLNNLGWAYKEQGRYSEAESLLTRALTIMENALVPVHSRTASILDNLAALYLEQSKYAQAEILYQRALAIREQVLGTEHFDTATSINNLALLYHTQGKFLQAEPLYLHSLALQEKILGPFHPEVATCLNNLAALYDEQGKYPQAELLYQRSIAIREHVLGPNHHYLAYSLNNLGASYQDQGKYAQAEPLLLRALAIREQALGPSHKEVASSLGRLALLYSQQGKQAEAEPLYLRALAIREQVLGPEHPDVARSLGRLAELYSAQGKHNQAEPLLQRALAIYDQSLGLGHPQIAEYLNNFAQMYINQGEYEKAEPLYQRALTIQEQSLGSEHPNVATSLENYANLLRKTKREAEATALEERARTIRTKQE